MSRRLNIEELLVGALFGAAFVFVLKGWVIITIPACALLWALGGQMGGSWRRIGVATVLSVVSAIACKSIWPFLSWPFLFAAISIGYGIPDPPPDGDDGSPVGRFFYYLLGQSDTLATIFTRGFIGFLIGLSLYPLGLYNMVGWIVGTLLCTIGFPAIVVLLEPGEIEY